jgi:hypothetical protein
VTRQASTRDIPAQLEIDAELLRHHLSAVLPELESGVEVSKFTGGQSNPTYLIESAGKRFVLRRKPRHRVRHRRHRRKSSNPQVRHRRTRSYAWCGTSLRAVAQAHRHTGVPISTHTHAASRRGLDQQKIFAEEGVDLTRVVIGHSGDTTDLDYLEELTANGSYICMDRFGIDALLSIEDRVKTVARMCERGHADKMVLSHDASCYWEALPEHMLPTILPNWHYLHVHDDVIPALKSHGVTEEQRHTMLVDNLRKIFSLKGGY